ncbi:hypothetical protein [Helicobacter pylori]|uniref:hypothetical protein n=1 Tax=Helicobacter pylori TaxID=210 RepID=UPI000EB12668|nr:hypothetical protein [Helicobacter pylori]
MSTLNLNPTKQGTYIQAPTNENNNINIGNESVVLKANQSQLQLNNNSIEVNAPQIQLKANAPINLNGASFTQAFNSILQALNQINITLQTIKYMPGSMSVPPITIDSQAITNSNGKVE